MNTLALFSFALLGLIFHILSAPRGEDWKQLKAYVSGRIRSIMLALIVIVVVVLTWHEPASQLFWSKIVGFEELTFFSAFCLGYLSSSIATHSKEILTQGYSRIPKIAKITKNKRLKK